MELWTLPALLAAGAIVGLATSLVGFTQWWEAGLWSVLQLVVAWTADVTTWLGGATFVGFAALAGMTCGLVQTALLGRYRANNPFYANEIGEDRRQVAKLFAGASGMRAALIGTFFAGVSAAIAAVS